MAVRVNMPQRQNISRGIQAPQIQARGRQLQAAAPAPPKQDWSAVGKSMMGLADEIKESRQKANRAKLVQSLVQEDDMGEGEAFNATVPQVQADGMEGMMQDSGVMGGPSAPATPKASRLSQLNMPDQAKAIFKEAVKSGDTDTAYKIAMKFALQPAKEYKLGKDDVVTDATGKIIAQGPASTPKPEKQVKAYDKKNKKVIFATPSEINADDNLQANLPATGNVTDAQVTPILNKLSEKKSLSRQELNLYKVWYADKNKISSTVDPQTQQIVTTKIADLSQFPDPKNIQAGNADGIVVAPPQINSNMQTEAPNIDSGMQTQPNNNLNENAMPQMPTNDGGVNNSRVSVADVQGLKKRPQSAETAGKISMASNALAADNVDDINDGLFEADGSIDRQVLLQLKSGQIVTPKAQMAYNALYRMMNGRLRIESGAAVPESEVQREMKAMMPSLIGAMTNEKEMTEFVRRALSKEINFFNTMLDKMGEKKMPAYFGNVATAPLETIDIDQLTDKQKAILDQRLPRLQ